MKQRGILKSRKALALMFVFLLLQTHFVVGGPYGEEAFETD
jgi:hypothetical protein